MQESPILLLQWASKHLREPIRVQAQTISPWYTAPRTFIRSEQQTYNPKLLAIITSACSFAAKHHKADLWFECLCLHSGRLYGLGTLAFPLQVRFSLSNAPEQVVPLTSLQDFTAFSEPNQFWEGTAGYLSLRTGKNCHLISDGMSWNWSGKSAAACKPDEFCCMQVFFWCGASLSGEKEVWPSRLRTGGKCHT